MKRTIDRVISGAPEHWVGDGFHVSNYFPSATESQKRMSPFFLLDYQKPENYSPTNKRRGVGSHPHRGFETVTIAYSGSIAHHDSVGNAGIITPNEVQWMTAGGGILHNEYHDANWAKNGGIMHMIQIWVNLPKKDKLTQPKYQALTKKSIPEIILPKNQGIVRVIAGSYGDQHGAADTFSSVHMLDLRLQPGAKAHFETPKDFNTAVLTLRGNISVNGSGEMTEGQFALLNNDGSEVSIESSADSIALFLSGEPIVEPLVHYGPFVMNSKDEINQAVDDYHAGKFGQLED